MMSIDQPQHACLDLIDLGMRALYESFDAFTRQIAGNELGAKSARYGTRHIGWRLFGHRHIRHEVDHKLLDHGKSGGQVGDDLVVGHSVSPSELFGAYAAFALER